MAPSDPPPAPSAAAALTSPRTASRAALATFLAVFGIAALLVVGFAIANPPSTETPGTTTTVKTTTVEGSPGPGASSATVTTEETRETMLAQPGLLDRLVTPPVWFLLELGVALLAAFVAAGAVQRILLGRYAFSIGPLTIPEITGESVATAGDRAIAGLKATLPTSTAMGLEAAGAAVGQAQALTAPPMDPNLALVSLRVEIERRLSRLAVVSGIAPSPRNSLRELLDRLVREEVVSRTVADALMQMIQLGNQAAHGVPVAPEAGAWAQAEGPRLIQALDAVADEREAERAQSGARS